MGAVDLVIQVEAPPSVASGLQRIGRAGHQVGEISQGVLFPKHRSDLISRRWRSQRMLAGQIETMRVPAQPARHPGPADRGGGRAGRLDVDRWFDSSAGPRRSRRCPARVLEATLDLLSGKYPSTEFAELRPRLVYDRPTGTLTAGPGAQRLAVTSGGAIPDRGLFTVYLAAESRRSPRRVGELDEEMVYESRPGDVIVLGATSWRITEITHDRVLVIPAPGQPGRLPFWRGDAPGRPAELGRRARRVHRRAGRRRERGRRQPLRAAGSRRARHRQPGGYLDEQREATGVVPDDPTLLVERFRDELGDWRVILHSPYGARVHGPWALAVAGRLRERYGIDEKPLPRRRHRGAAARHRRAAARPGSPLFDADEIDPIVTAEVGGSALFASRFRECAARALLLPRRQPGRRSPLWQQRQRAAQLLEVARKYPHFPIVLETVRECLQDVYDVPGADRADARPRRPQGAGARGRDAAPVAVRRVAAVRLRRRVHVRGRRAAGRAAGAGAVAGHRRCWPSCSARRSCASCSIPTSSPTPAASCSSCRADRASRDAEAVADLLRLLGPLTADEVAARCPPAATPRLAGRAGRRSGGRSGAVAGRGAWVAIEDIGRLRDALGVPLPVGVPAAFTEPVRRPAGRPGGPVRAHPRAVHHRRRGRPVRARAWRWSPARWAGWRRRAGSARVSSCPAGAAPNGATPRCCGCCAAAAWPGCARRSSRSRRRRLPAFLPAWQGAGSRRPPGAATGRDTGRGPGCPPAPDAVLDAVEQLAGAPVPASALETLVLPGPGARLLPRHAGRADRGRRGRLDRGRRAARRRRMAGAGAGDAAPLLLPAPSEITMTPLHEAVLAALDDGGAVFFRMLAERVAGLAAGGGAARRHPTPTWPRRSGTCCGRAA